MSLANTDAYEYESTYAGGGYVRAGRGIIRALARALHARMNAVLQRGVRACVHACIARAVLHLKHKQHRSSSSSHAPFRTFCCSVSMQKDKRFRFPRGSPAFSKGVAVSFAHRKQINYDENVEWQVPLLQAQRSPWKPHSSRQCASTSALK